MTLKKSQHRVSASKQKDVLLLWACLIVIVGIVLSPTSARTPSDEMPLSPESQPSVQQARRGANEGSSAQIADGEYQIDEPPGTTGAGPFEEDLFNFHESWTLFRSGRGYEVIGNRHFESPLDGVHTEKFVVELSRDMSIIKITDFTKLRWVRDSGPLTCDFYPNVLHCSAGGLHPDKSLQLQTHLDDPYGLLWPVSPFSLSGITREVERDPKHPANVELISIEQPSRANPVAATILKGRMTYLGEDLIQAGGQTWQAHKFSLKVALHPQFVIWTSRQGFLLAMVTEHKHPNWMNEGLRLAHFQSAPDFR